MKKSSTLQKLICEELNISQNVISVAQKLLPKILADANLKVKIPKDNLFEVTYSEYPVQLLGNDYMMYCRFFHFRNMKERQEYRKVNKKQNSSYNSKHLYGRMTIDIINGWYDENSIFRDLYHELSHLHFHNMKGDEGDNTKPLNSIYKTARRNFTYNSDNFSKAAQAVYIRGTNEMSAFTHGLYGELISNDEWKTHKSPDNILKKSPVYLVYKNLEEFENDILNDRVDDLKELANEYNISTRQLFAIVKHAKQRLGAAIARVMALVYSEKEINEITNPYSSYVRATFED